ncbi:hypothetical protein BGW41_003869 [Actinomortierella wolfii]|nr:hypothetical protein BGW41_003869 [Actinomortierella wolfii]
MAACYSSGATAPLHGLANAMLGESSFAAKSSTFSPAHTKSAANSLHSHHHHQHSSASSLPPSVRHSIHQHNQLLQPLSPIIRSQPPSFSAARHQDSFEQAWSQHAQQHHPTPADLVDPSAEYYHFAQLHGHHQPFHAQAPPAVHFSPSPIAQHHHNHRPQDDFDQMWQQHSAPSETTAITPASHVQPTTQQTQTQPPARATTAVDSSTLLEDFQRFVYQPKVSPTTLSAPNNEHLSQKDTILEEAWNTSSHATATATTDASASSWAEELNQQEDDSEDEFSQEWSNEAFTAAYIAANKAEFDRIQAIGDERERRRLENQEQQKEQRRQAGIPIIATVGDPSSCTCTGQASHMASTRSSEPADQDDQHLLLYKEFMRFNKDPNSASLLNTENHAHPQHHHHQQLQPTTWESEFAQTTTTCPPTQGTITPIRHADGFESMTTDLYEAAMLYHTAARTKSDQRDHTDEQEAKSLSDDAWANEFASMHLSQSPLSLRDQRASAWHRYHGEWDWQSMFGKVGTTQQQQLLAQYGESVDKVHNSGELRHMKSPDEQALEHQRLQAVALSRLAALFGHLSMQTDGSK